MFITSRKIGFSLLGSFLLSGGVWAATSAVEGKVIDQNGKPLNGAEIRFEESKGGNGLSKVVKTDASGHYINGALTAGKIYRVSLVLNGTVKGAVNNVQPKIGDSTKLNFDLRKSSGSQTAATKTGRHKVWVASETGSHLGGRWVEVDDEHPSAIAGTENVRKAGNDAVRGLQMGGR